MLRGGPIIRDWSGELVGCIRGADRGAANALLNGWAETRSNEEAITGLHTPALELFGNLWADKDGETSLVQGYVAAKVAEDLLGRVPAAGPGVFPAQCPLARLPGEARSCLL